MSVYYPAGCDALIPDHVCDPCETIEQGRVRSVAFIKKDFVFTDPSSPTQWRTGFLADKIIIIPQTKGTFDGGAEVEGPGYGDQSTRLTGYNFSANFEDPNYKKNCGFYNNLKNSREWRFAYRTGSQIHITDTVVQVIPKNPVADDLNSEVVWNVIVKWSDNDLPCPFDVPPGTFDACTYNT